MTFGDLVTKVKLLKSISDKMDDARVRVSQWSPRPGCSNIVRSNYHKAYKDLGKYEKDLRNDLLSLFKLLKTVDFDINKLVGPRYSLRDRLFIAGVFIVGVLVGKLIVM